MDMISLLGQILADKSGSRLIHAKGLIRLALSDAGKADANLEVKEMIQILDNQVKQRLTNVKLGDPHDLVKHLTTELVKKQSLLTMSA